MEQRSATRLSVNLDAFPGWSFDVVVDRSGTITEFRVRTDDKGSLPKDRRSPAGITSRFVRSVPLGELRLRALEQLHASTDAADPLVSAQLEAWTQAFRTDPRPGRRGRPDVDYARLAAAYVALRPTDRPAHVLAQRLGRPVGTVWTLLTEARRRGLLTAPDHGLPGGELTPRGRAVLEQATTEPNTELDEFATRILPALKHVPLRRLAEKTGLSVGYCSKVRNGQVIPNREHWGAFQAATESS